MSTNHYDENLLGAAPVATKQQLQVCVYFLLRDSFLGFLSLVQVNHKTKEKHETEKETVMAGVKVVRI